MYYILRGHNMDYTVLSMIQTFYPNESHLVFNNRVFETSNVEVLESVVDGDKVSAFLYESGKITDKEETSLISTDEVSVRREIKYTIYNLLKRRVGVPGSWGLLTGIRPAKIVTELKESGMSYEEIKSHLENFYCVDSDKADLAISVSKNEYNIIKDNDGRDMSLYIGIPFCPSRCLYCSFTSYNLEKYKNKTGAYLDALVKEINYGSEYAIGRRLESIYIGGGTPTSLDDYEIEKLLYSICEKFSMEDIKEFTVEAGRPDTITLSKLKILKKYNVSRISINPQTMNDKTLMLVGRSHTVDDFKNKFELARHVGFTNINVDLILGLLGETVSDMDYTMQEVLKLNPENITVHTLAVKRASKLKEDLSSHSFLSMKDMEKILKSVKDYTESIGMLPYYLYRQKNTVGNFENVGYSKKGFESLYNVQIMEERQDILALGAGGASKFVNLDTNKIERVFNVKSVDDYINRIDEMIIRKKNMEDIL